jgi:glycyl-tRNA synthetase beta chain
MSDFLLELLSEEIPARMQAKACTDLARLFAEQLSQAGLRAEAIETYATPRRLALIARNLPAETASASEELKGPRASAPPQALEGFLRKTGLTREQLTERDGIYFAIIDKPGRATTAVLAEAIPAIIRAFPWPKSMRWGEASIATESLRWVRPLQGIVALLGEEIVEVEIAGVRSGAATVGHRFHHPGIITIGSANDYVEKLTARHVIVDPAERQRIIRAGAEAAAETAGLRLVEDEGLVAENAGLTEWPVPLLGRFDSAFLEVPPEVIQLTMRTNQKYFALVDGQGSLAPNFVCTANIDASDGGAAIVAGNEKVLAARLSDAKFFWEQDLKVPLEEQAKKLGAIVFHEKLGTVADKVERVAKLARWLVEEGIVGGSTPSTATNPRHPRESGDPASSPSAAADQEQLDSRFRGNDGDLAQQAETAARLCKADLVTGMVGEFPELQGLIGGYLARAQGQPDAVADAIRDHYKPVGQGDEVPSAPVTVAVSLADKLDTIAAFFLIAETPTGSKDPFALRRAALGILQIISRLGIRLPLEPGIRLAHELIIRQPAPRDPHLKFLKFEQLVDKMILGSSSNPPMWVEVGRPYEPSVVRNCIAFILRDVAHHCTADGRQLQDVKNHQYQGLAIAEARELSFFADRLKVQQREAGVRHDLIDAVFALGGEDDLVRLLARVRALQAFVETAEGKDLLAGYKRAANILKKEGWQTPSPLRGEGRGEGERASSERPSPGDNNGHRTPSPNPLPEGEGFSLSYTPETEEAQLIAALYAAEPRAAAAIQAEDFEGAMAALALLRAPVDAFFDKVTVNDPDPAKREARLALLGRMRDAVHRVADCSPSEG